MSIVKLKSSDGLILEVEKEVAEQSALWNTMFKDTGFKSGEEIPVSIVDESTLEIVIKWATHFKDVPSKDVKDKKSKELRKEFAAWENKFLSKMGMATLVKVMNAANYIDMKNLTDAGLNFIKDKIETNSAEKLEKIFGIV